MINNTAEILNKGMECLRAQLGIVEAETFIYVVNREQFDYTKWHRTAFDNMTLEELNEAAVEYNKEHPHVGKAKVV